MLQIAVINESTAINDDNVQAMLSAFDTQWNQDLNAAWGVGSAQFTFTPNTTAPPAGAWWIVFLDNSDQANALASPDLTNEALTISTVFAKTIQAANASVRLRGIPELA